MNPPAAPEAYDTARYLVQALVSLVLVVGLIYALYYVLRRVQGTPLNLRQTGPARLVQSLPLAGGNALHVVRVGDKTVLVASGPQGVTVVERTALLDALAAPPEGGVDER